MRAAVMRDSKIVVDTVPPTLFLWDHTWFNHTFRGRKQAEFSRVMFPAFICPQHPRTTRRNSL